MPIHTGIADKGITKKGETMGLQTLFSEQRVGVFVDVQNMYYSAKNLYNAKVNFAAILKTAVGPRKIIRAFAYVIRADVKDEQNFFDALSKIGFEIREKDLQTFAGGAKKGDWDIGIAMDCIELAPKLDTIILVSGDGDFVPLLSHVRHALGCRVEVMAIGRSSSAKLKETADLFVDLDQNIKKYLIPAKTRTYFEQEQKQQQPQSKIFPPPQPPVANEKNL